ncbi:transposase family protein [Streptomyces sp. NPDC091377]|uniref:helix-turn-helix domain-containing protein n=1 Tax=Streptomyces sp. NPDC091377 TaxID=3365995 RepID=UPI003823816E
MAAYWRTNLTLRQLAPLFGISKSAADRIVDHLGPALALQPRRRYRKESVLIVDGTPGAHPRPGRGHLQQVLPLLHQPPGRHRRRHRLVVAVGKPLPGNRNDCRA